MALDTDIRPSCLHPPCLRSFKDDDSGMRNRVSLRQSPAQATRLLLTGNQALVCGSDAVLGWGGAAARGCGSQGGRAVQGRVGRGGAGRGAQPEGDPGPSAWLSAAWVALPPRLGAGSLTVPTLLNSGNPRHLQDAQCLLSRRGEAGFSPSGDGVKPPSSVCHCEPLAVLLRCNPPISHLFHYF